MIKSLKMSTVAAVLVLFLFVVWIYLGWNFPGHCTSGDGLKCAPRGIAGLADYVLGIRSGGPMAGIALLIFLPILGVMFWGISKIISRISLIPKVGPLAAIILLFLIGVWIFASASSVKWEPTYSKGAIEWYGREGDSLTNLNK